MLPQDPFILLSYVNTQLRDRYSSLEAFCEEQEIPPAALISKLDKAGFQYIPELNQFR